MPDLPPADILIHSGDFTNEGAKYEIKKFCQYLDAQKQIKYKIVISGNHEFQLDYKSYINFSNLKLTKEQFQLQRQVKLQQLSKSCIYLENSGVQILGLNIYGTPYTYQFRSVEHSFQKKCEEDLEKEWKQIPSDTDLLVTHSPPLHQLDITPKGIHGGSPSLLQQVNYRVNPILHQFGHIHHSYGITHNQSTLFINAASCDEHYQTGEQGPIVIAIPKPYLHTTVLTAKL